LKETRMMNNIFTEVVIVIPSLNPDENMVKYVEGLGKKFSNIVVIDDGSIEECKKYFDEIAGCESVKVLHHDINRGKGRALKTGFQYVLENYANGSIKGVLTADADGQHSVEDTIKVARELVETEDFVLGSRDFDKENVPFKSRSGNKITTCVFALLYGRWLKDTQTGLRGIPFSYLNECVELAGEKFEYEIMMLIDMVRKRMKIKEVSIETIYIESNRATHFHAIKDSFRIYKVILNMFLKFSMSGILSFLVDISMFAFLTKTIFGEMGVAENVLLGTVIARVVSSIVNYLMNRKFVFISGNDKIRSLIKYYVLCCMQLLCSWVLVVKVYNCVQFDTSIIKIMVDTLLFFISFQVQQRWVFTRGTK